MLYIKKLFLTGIFICCSVALQAQSTDTFNLNEVYSIDSEGTISLSSDDAEVMIIGSNRSDIHVEIHYEFEVTGFSFGDRTKFNMTVREENGN